MEYFISFMGQYGMILIASLLLIDSLSMVIMEYLWKSRAIYFVYKRELKLVKIIIYSLLLVLQVLYMLLRYSYGIGEYERR